MDNALFDDFVSTLKASSSKDGVMLTTSKEMKENQFGLPLQHYAQQYLFGATGLRIGVFHSIAGPPQACKSPLLFDLMGHICAPKESNGLGGIGFLYELEDKISPTLLDSILASHGVEQGKTLIVIPGLKIEEAMKHITKSLLPTYRSKFAKSGIPIIVGMDSIGGAASKDTVDKLAKEGSAGKGFYDKAHFMKYFCENAGQLIKEIPIVVMCINQEKEKAAATPYSTVPVKSITGGASQVFKDGHMISARHVSLANGAGKIVTLKTTKTSFSDARKIEVEFTWNRYGDNADDMYDFKFNWALASAKCIADPEKGVGDIRDICDVKISDKNLVTCPQLDLKSVTPEEFEAALFANKELLNQLYTYQKIDVIKDVDAFMQFQHSAGKTDTKDAEQEVKKPRKKAAAKSAAEESKDVS